MSNTESTKLLARLSDLRYEDQKHQKDRTACTAANCFIQEANRELPDPKWYHLQIGAETFKCPPVTEESDGDATPLATTMRGRHNGRRLVGELLLKHSMKKHDSPAQSCTVLGQDNQTSCYILSVGKQWLYEFDKELLEEKKLLNDFARRQYRTCTQTECQQIASWEAESASQQDLWSRVLKLVLEAQVKERASRASRAALVLAKITQLPFPPELLILVVEFVVESQLPRCTIATSNTADTLAGEVFAIGEDTDSGTRNLLGQMASKALVKASSIRIGAKFTLSYTLNTPPLLAGREQHLRHLELDLYTHVFNDWPHFQLNRSIEGIASMTAHFTGLETCTMLCHFQHHAVSEPIAEVFNTANINMLDVRNLKTSQNVDKHTLRDTLFALIKAFAEQGPRNRKFIRFSHASRIGEKLGHRPLVPVDNRAGLNEAQDKTATAGHKHPRRFRPGRILKRAYLGPLTLVVEVFKADRAEVVTLQEDGALRFETIHS